MVGRATDTIYWEFDGDIHFCKQHLNYARKCVGVATEVFRNEGVAQYKQTFNRADGLDVHVHFMHGITKVAMYYPLSEGKEDIPTQYGVIWWQEDFDPNYYSGTRPWTDHSVVFDAVTINGTAPDLSSFSASRTLSYDVGQTDYLGTTLLYSDNPKIQANYEYLRGLGVAVDESRAYTANIDASGDLVGQHVRPPFIDPVSKLALVVHEDIIYFGGVALDDTIDSLWESVALYDGQLYKALHPTHSNIIYIETRPLNGTSADWTVAANLPLFAPATDPNLNSVWFDREYGQYMQWHPTEPRVCFMYKNSSTNVTDYRTAEEIAANASSVYTIVAEAFLDGFGSWQAEYRHYFWVNAYAFIDDSDPAFYTQSFTSGMNYSVDTITDIYQCAPNLGDPDYAYFEYGASSTLTGTYFANGSATFKPLSVSGSSRGDCPTDVGYTPDGDLYIIGCSTECSYTYSGYTYSFSFTATMTDSRETTLIPTGNCGDALNFYLDITYTNTNPGNMIITIPDDSWSLSKTASMSAYTIYYAGGGSLFAFPDFYTLDYYATPISLVVNEVGVDCMGYPYGAYTTETYTYTQGDTYVQGFLYWFSTSTDNPFIRAGYANPELDVELYAGQGVGPTGAGAYFWYRVSLDTEGSFYANGTQTLSYTYDINDSVVGGVYDYTYSDISYPSALVTYHKAYSYSTAVQSNTIGVTVIDGYAACAEQNLPSDISVPSTITKSTSEVSPTINTFHAPWTPVTGLIMAFKYHPWNDTLWGYRRATMGMTHDTRTGYYYGTSYNYVPLYPEADAYMRWRATDSGDIDYTEWVTGLPATNPYWTINYLEHSAKLV
jgi:hypothetical protein